MLPTQLLLSMPLWFVAAVSSAPTPDQWFPFMDQRVVSPSGRRYVVVKEQGLGIRFEFCERAVGAAPMAAAGGDFLAGPAVVDRDPADTLLANGAWGQLPLDVIVPERLPGFVLFEKHGGIGRGKVVTWIDGTGTAVFSLTLRDLFGDARTGALVSMGSTCCEHGHWLDEARQVFVVVAHSGEVREVSLWNGAVTTPGAERLVSFATVGPAPGRALALEALAQRGAEVLQQATPLAMLVFHAANEPLELRVRAAVLLVRAAYSR